MSGVTKSIIGVLVGVAMAAALLFAIMAIRAVNYGGPLDIEEIDLPPPPAFDARQVTRHLSQAIKFKTITTNPGDPATLEAAEPWLAMHAWMEETYPRVHSQLSPRICEDLFPAIHMDGQRSVTSTDYADGASRCGSGE